MFREIDKFLSNYPNIINACIALGTVCSVIVSLCLANKNSKPNLKGEITRRIIFEQNFNNEIVQNDKSEYIALDLKNLGNIPVHFDGCNGFSFSFPFGKLDLITPPLEPACLNKTLTIEPYSSKMIILSRTNQLLETIKEYCNEYKYPKFLIPFIKFNLNTSTNFTYRVKIHKTVISHILNNL